MGYATRYLGKIITIKIDRPLGTKHPRYNYKYLINYGFVPDTKAPDGHEVDAYVLGISKPLEEFTGKCIAVIHRINDEDDKLILVPKGISYTNEDIMKFVEFQEKFFKSEIIRHNPLVNHGKDI